MIIKVFNQGTSDGSRHIDYLLDESSHQGHKPEVMEGNPELTKAILRSMSNRKTRYTAGVLSFKNGENLSESQQRELIADFKNAFAPFDDESRSNFLFVRHYDKGRLEIHWVSARQDLKTGLAWNIFVPGRANTLFYESFVRLQNYRYGFQQVDGKTMTTQDIAFYSKTFSDLHQKRKAYMASRYDKPRNHKNNNTRRTRYATTKPNRASDGPAHQENFRAGKLIELIRPQVGTDRANHLRGDQSSKHGATNDYPAQNGATKNADWVKDYLNSSNSTEWRGREQFGKSKINNPALSIEDEIYAVALELNTCEKHEIPALIARLNYLKGVKEHCIPREKPKFK